MGLSISELNGHKRVWHNGETNGSVAMNATYPNDDLAIIVFENSLGADTNAIEHADRPGATRYTYRAQFARRAVTFVIIINKTTHLLDAMGIRPE